MIDDLRFRLRALFRRRTAEDDLDDELHFHLERAVERHEAGGLSRREARRRARIEFGQLDVVKEDCRRSWGIRQVDALGQDLDYAFRLLRKHPGLSAAAAVSLAVGIGLNTALFALLDATLLRRLPVDRQEQLVDVYTSDLDGFTWQGSSHPDYVDLRRHARALTGIAGYVPAMGAVRVGERSRVMPGEAVTGAYFEVIGASVVHGRALSADDDLPGAEPVVVISSAFWSEAFDRDPGVLDRPLHIGGRPYAVVGVASGRFTGMTAPLLTAAFWTPMRWVDDVQPVVMHNGSAAPGATRLESRGLRWMLVKGRLRAGETARSAAEDLNRVMLTLEAAYPESNDGIRVTVVPTSDVATHPLVEERLRAGAASLAVLLGLVLLVGCANVAGLLLVRTSARRREIGLRLAVGASRARLVRQLLVESLVLAALGVVGGVALAWVLLHVLGAVRVPLLIPVAFDLAISGRVLGLSVIVAAAAGLVAGSAPAWTATRSGVLAELLGYPAAWSLGNRRWSLRETIVALQVAVSLVLLVMAGLLVRNLLVASRADPGFPAGRIASLTLGFGLVGYGEDEAGRFFDLARERVRALPGVQAVARASRAPLSINYNQTRIRPAGQPRTDGFALAAGTATVGPEYFESLGVQLLRGRPFDDAVDTPSSPRVAIVNETLAGRLWPDSDAVGRRIRSVAADPGEPPVEVVGVVRDYRVRFLQEPPTPYVHYAASQRPAGMLTAPVLLVRTAAGDARALGARVRRQLRGIDPDMVYWPGLTLDDNVASQLLPARVLAALLGTAGAVAVWLAAIGLYGVVAHSIVRRRREIGIRMTLGATRRDVLRLVLRQGVVLLVSGAVLGTVLAFLAARATAGLLFGIDAADPLAWCAAIAVLVTAGALAHAVPTLRAVRVHPSAALRTE